MLRKMNAKNADDRSEEQAFVTTQFITYKGDLPLYLPTKTVTKLLE
jgi:hypothetical protein